MTDYSDLKAFDVKTDESTRYDMADIMMNGQTPFLMVKPATEANKPFARAQLLHSNKRVRQGGSRGISLETIQGTRDDDRALYPKFIITDWGNVFDSQKKPVVFSEKECTEFLKALPDWIFDNLRNFCSSPQNFSGSAVTDEDKEALGN